MSRLLCLLLGRHRLSVMLVRRTDGRVAQVRACRACGASA
jgi:hypothetical protein